MRPSLSTRSLLELLSLFEQGHQRVAGLGGQHLRGVPAWGLRSLQHLSPDQVDTWTDRIGYAASYPVPCGDDLLPVDLDEEDDSRFSYLCPETFRVKHICADAAAVRAVAADRLLNCVADLLNIPHALRRGIEAPAIPDVLWHLGKMRVGKVHVDVWLVRGLAICNEEVLRYFEKSSVPNMGLILAAGAGLPSLMRQIRDYRVVAISDVLIEGATPPEIDDELLHRILVGAPSGTPAAAHPVQFDELGHRLTIATRSIEPWQIKGKVQAAVVHYLVQQVHLNRRWVPAREIRDAVYGPESSGRSERISEIFKGNTRWQDYIEQDGAGQYSIKLD